MQNEISPDDARNVWTNQPEEGGKMPLDEIRRKANKFEGRIRRRNLAEYLAILFLLAFVVLGLYGNLMPRTSLGYLAGGLTVAAGLFVGYQLWRRGSARSLPEDCGLKCCIEFHRTELERQRDLLHRIWSWYLGPFVPAMLMSLVATAAAHKPPFPHHGLPFGVVLATLSLVFFWVWKVNHRAERRLQRQIDELEAVAKQQLGGRL